MHILTVEHVTRFLQTFLLPLSKDSHGSRVVDALWQHCEVGRKPSLAQELMAHEQELSADFYGRIVLRNCNIAHYKKKQAAWQEGQKVADRRRQLFEDIISEPEAVSVGRKGTGKKRRGQQSSQLDKDEGHSSESKKKKSRSVEIPVKRKIPLFEVRELLFDSKSQFMRCNLSVQSDSTSEEETLPSPTKKKKKL